MLEEAEARERILDLVAPGLETSVSLREALDRHVARDLMASVSLPGFDNSQMDGYAVRSADACEGSILRVTGEQPAGPDRNLHVEQGTAVRVFTGAPLPSGADAVVMQEDTTPDPESPDGIRILDGTKSGEFIRRKGCDLCPGQVIFRKGDIITPARIGVAASQGLIELPVIERPSVSIVTTGDELISPGTPPRPGELYNSNGPMLEALATRTGSRISSTSHAPDNPSQLRETLERAMAESRFCLISGGVSVGDHDHVKTVLASLGMKVAFWRVRVKPGKPLLFGTRDDRIIFGLPGNPVSAHVTFLLFVLPALMKAAGASLTGSALPLPVVAARLTANVRNPGDRPHYLRMTIDHASGAVHPAGLQQSHALNSLGQANSLLRLNAGQEISEGTIVSCLTI